MARPIRILFYAINGTGLGHLSRLLNLARSARELLEILGVGADFHLITTSEAPQLAWDFPVYKLPSKRVVKDAGADAVRFVQSAKLMVANLTANLSPDLLVLDTEPQGAFQDFVFLRGFAQATAFIDRHKAPKVAAREVHQRHLQLYDRILVPDDLERAARYPAPFEIQRKRRFIGRVHGYRPEAALPADEVRRQLGVHEDHQLVYLSAGGGGDSTAQRSLNAVIDALAEDPSLHLVIGYGPLFRGEQRRGPRLTALSEPDLSRYFSGFDAAVSAAGYNTFFELLGAEVPTIFFSQAKGMDRQDERLEWGAAHGLCGHFGPGGLDPALCSPQQIRASVQSVLHGEFRSSLCDALEARAPDHGAVTGATELLALIASLSDARLKRSEIMELGAWRRSWSPRPGADFARETHWTRTWARRALSPSARIDLSEHAAQAFVARTPMPGIHLEFGAVLEKWRALGVSPEVLERLLVVWTSDPEARTTMAASEQALLQALDVLEEAPEPSALLTWLLSSGSARETADRIRRLSATLDHPSVRIPNTIPPSPLDPNEFEAWVRVITNKEKTDATTHQG